MGKNANRIRNQGSPHVADSLCVCPERTPEPEASSSNVRSTAPRADSPRLTMYGRCEERDTGDREPGPRERGLCGGGEITLPDGHQSCGQDPGEDKERRLIGDGADEPGEQTRPP